MEYEMSEKDLETLIEAGKPTPAIKIRSYIPPSPQENANRAWEALGKKMGFDYMTVIPIKEKGNQFFNAVPLNEMLP